MNKLRDRLKQIWLLNINWMVSAQKIFPIKSDDLHWQECVSVLLEDASLIIVDVSNPREALQWEISQCVQTHLQGRLVFLCDREKAENGRAWIAKCAHDSPSIQSVPVFLYGARGLDDHVAFKAFVVETLSRSLVAEPAPSPRQLIFGLGVNVAASLLIAIGGTVAMAPYIFPEAAMQYSPSHWQII